MTEETEKPEQELTARERSNAQGKANLDAHRAATQFGGENGNIPNNGVGGAGTKTWSVRHSVKYLAGQPVDMSDPKKAFALLLPPKPTVAQVIAANALAKATKADMRAVEYVTEQIDGKLAQTNLNADFAHIKNLTDEQIDAALDEFERQRALKRDASHGDVSGTPAETGSETPA